MDIDRRRLQEEMIDLLGAEPYHFDSEVTGVEKDGETVALVLADGSRRSGELAIGGDGIHSIVRDRVLGQEGKLKQTRYDVIEGIASLDERHLSRGHHKQVWGATARCGVGWVSDERVRWFLGGRSIALADDPKTGRRNGRLMMPTNSRPLGSWYRGGTRQVREPSSNPRSGASRTRFVKRDSAFLGPPRPSLCPNILFVARSGGRSARSPRPAATVPGRWR